MDRVFSLLFTLSISIFVCGRFIRGSGDVELTGNYTWIVTEWSECSASCGGVRVRSVQCVDGNGQASKQCQPYKPDTRQLCKNCNSEGVYWSKILQHMHRVLTTRSRRTLQSEHNSSAITFESDIPKPPRELQQQTTLEWTVSPWSDCSATCGGGFQVRSVRCLDECGIISARCNGSKERRPPTYEFCGQTDCVTGIMDDGIIPPNGLTISSIPDGSLSLLDFFSSSIDMYMISHNITENDGTLTILMETLVNGMRTFSCQARPVDIAITVDQSMGENVILLNGEFLFTLESVETTIIRIGQMVMYENSTVTVLGPNTEFPNIAMFWYCDSFRCYTFNSSKSFLRSGPTSKLFTSKEVALYSIAGPINAAIEDILENPPVIPTSSIPMTPSPATTIVSSSFFTIKTTLFSSIIIFSPSVLETTSVLETVSIPSVLETVSIPLVLETGSIPSVLETTSIPSVLETTSIFTSVLPATTTVFSPTPTSQLVSQTPSISSLMSPPFESITLTLTSFPTVTLTSTVLVTPTPTDEAPPTTKKPEKTRPKTRGRKKCIVKLPISKSRDFFIDDGTRTTTCCRRKTFNSKERVSYDITRETSTQTRGTVPKNKATRKMTAEDPSSGTRTKTCGKKKGTQISITIGTDTDDRTRTGKGFKTKSVDQLTRSTTRKSTTDTRARKRTRTTTTNTRGIKSRGRGTRRRRRTSTTDTRGIKSRGRGTRKGTRTTTTDTRGIKSRGRGTRKRRTSTTRTEGTVNKGTEG